jgi:parallel beta-helix repeat protein
MQNPPFIGIDFGTTNSSVAWINPRDEKAEVLANAESETKTPSVVYFGTDETIVGAPVELLLEDFKSLDEEERGDEMMRVVRSIKRNLVSPPLIPLPDGKDVQPVEVVAEILRKLKRDAEAEHFHAPVERAVITCPAVFDTKQRGKILEAAKLAGFKEVELVEEPVAAALAFANSDLEECRNVLVYDLGGGTFDLAVVAKDDDSFRVAMETDGDANCGGDDFDQALYNFWDAQACQQFGQPISTDEGQLDQFFLRECRRRKELLSMKAESGFSSLLAGGRTFRPKVTRADFERLIRPQLEKTIHKTAELYKKARDKGLEVDTVVMIGGSTRIPLIGHMLKETLGVEPRRWLNKDVAVALGAAYYARELWSPRSTAPSNLVVSAQGGGQFRTISEAVAKARPGSRVVVRPGIYRESVVIAKELEIVGDGAAGDVIIESTERPCISMETERALVRGFTLRTRSGLGGTSVNTVDLKRGHLLLEDCDVSADAGECIHVEGAKADPLIRKCRVHSAKEQCLFFTEDARGLIEDCDIYSSASEAIGILNGASPVVNRCRIHSSVAGVTVGENGRGTFEDCEIYDNSKYNVVVSGGEPAFLRCKMHGGCEDEGGSIVITGKAKGRFDACDIYGARVGVLISEGAEPLLTGSRVHDFTRGVIVSAQGLGVFENCEIFKNEEFNVMTVDGAIPVFLRCGIHDSQHFGLYIDESGAGTFEDCEIYRNAEVNVFVTGHSDPTLRNCRVSGGGNAGVAVQDRSRGTFDNCDIFDHQGWNVAILDKADPKLNKCRIHSGKRSGVRIFQEGRGKLYDCDIYDNAEAQVVIADESDPAVLSCRIRRGTNVGIFVTDGGRGRIKDCDINENEEGGVGIGERGNPSISKCRIMHNKVGILILPAAGGTIKNCDLSNNVEGAWEMEAADSSPVRSGNTVDVDEEIKCVLNRFQQLADFFVNPNIPSGKLSNAMESCRTKAKMPNWEQALALLDCTVFGSAKNCVVFARKGIYFTNHDTSGSILYRDFPANTFKTSGYYIKYDGGSINVAGSAQNSEKVMTILNAIKQIY